MALISDVNRVLYRPLEYANEKEFEKVVTQLADAMFGPSTIYVESKDAYRETTLSQFLTAT
jgi:hypothetical protein